MNKSFNVKPHNLIRDIHEDIRFKFEFDCNLFGNLKLNT